MTIEQCITWKNKFSKTKREDSPWNTSFDQMALKTVVKVLIRNINKVPTIILNNQNDINLALQLDQGVIIDSETIA